MEDEPVAPCHTKGPRFNSQHLHFKVLGWKVVQKKRAPAQGLRGGPIQCACGMYKVVQAQGAAPIILPVREARKVGKVMRWMCVNTPTSIYLFI